MAELYSGHPERPDDPPGGAWFDPEDDLSALGDQDHLTVFYSLIGPEFDRLRPLDGEQQLVFSLGESQVSVTLGSDQSVTLDDPSHLEHLAGADLLTLQLLMNHDAGNVLWEWTNPVVRLIADMHRNGQIHKYRLDDHTPSDVTNTPVNPLRLWVNDDKDHAGLEAPEVLSGKTGASDEPGSHVPDHGARSFRGVSGMRDLVDFFPLQVDVEAALELYPSSQYLYRLRHPDAALNFFETTLIHPVSDVPLERPDATLRDPAAGSNGHYRVTADPTVLPDACTDDHYFIVLHGCCVDGAVLQQNILGISPTGAFSEVSSGGLARFEYHCNPNEKDGNVEHDRSCNLIPG